MKGCKQSKLIFLILTPLMLIKSVYNFDFIHCELSQVFHFSTSFEIYEKEIFERENENHKNDP